jgi:ribosomal protein S27AE
MTKNSVVEDDEIVCTSPFCPRRGEGVFILDRGEWWSCGKCGDRYRKTLFGSASSEKNGKHQKY